MHFHPCVATTESLKHTLDKNTGEVMTYNDTLTLFIPSISGAIISNIFTHTHTSMPHRTQYTLRDNTQIVTARINRDQIGCGYNLQWDTLSATEQSLWKCNNISFQKRKIIAPCTRLPFSSIITVWAKPTGMWVITVFTTFIDTFLESTRQEDE